MPKLITTHTRIADLGMPRMSFKSHLKCAFKSYDGREVLFNTGEKLITRTMIRAAGVKGHPIQGISADVLRRGARVRTNKYSRVSQYQNIVAIGDIALMKGDSNFPKSHSQMAQPAIQQKRLVARNTNPIITQRTLKPFRYNDMEAPATMGRNRAVANFETFKPQGFFAWLVWMFIHVVSVISFKNKFFVLASSLTSNFPYDKSNKLNHRAPQKRVQ